MGGKNILNALIGSEKSTPKEGLVAKFNAEKKSKICGWQIGERLILPWNRKGCLYDFVGFNGAKWNRKTPLLQ
ncbi:unnamed protein product [Absidia cylindrospora]